MILMCLIMEDMINLILMCLVLREHESSDTNVFHLGNFVLEEHEQFDTNVFYLGKT